MKPSVWHFALLGTASAAMEVDFDSRESIIAAAALKAHDVMSFYHGREPGQTPGILSSDPSPGGGAANYVWWQAGALWGAMIDYWKYTGDASYNDMLQESLLFQTGPDRNYMPPNVTAFIGNDDQAFWGLSAMLAAETNFQNPRPADPQWLALAQAVWNSQTDASRRDDACGGGLRWQISALSTGYDYKNAIANGLYFNLAARLARYTGDDAYARHASSTFDWLRRVGLVDPGATGTSYAVYDGAHVASGCADVNRAQFSYNTAVLLHGAAFMHAHTRGAEPVWAQRVDGLLGGLLDTFTRGGVLFEPACEAGAAAGPAAGCTTDMRAFKGFSARWMAAAAVLCPWTRGRILAVLRASAEEAVRHCTTGGDGRRACGMSWAPGSGFDGTVGVGEEMNVLSALMVLLIEEEEEQEAGPAGGGEDDDDDEYTDGGTGPEQPSYVPLTHDTGGTSKGDPGAGKGLRSSNKGTFRPVTDADTIGAASLTSLVVVAFFVVFIFMCTGASEDAPMEKSRGPCNLPRQPRAEVVVVKAPPGWQDLEQRRPARRRPSQHRVRPRNERHPAPPGKCRPPATHKTRAVHLRDDDLAFRGDRVSGVDSRGVRKSRARGGAGNLDRTRRKTNRHANL